MRGFFRAVIGRACAVREAHQDADRETRKTTSSRTGTAQARMMPNFFMPE